MIVDLIITAWVVYAAKSALLFWLLLFIAVWFRKPGRPFYSGILRFALLMMGISLLFSIFGGGDDCDCDL